MAFRVIEIQPTPNPNAVKFMLDGSVSEQPTSFFNAQSAVGNKLAEQLFQIQGVSSLLLLGDFITVNKRPEADWKEIKKEARKVLQASD